jgi:HNH endonuclease
VANDIDEALRTGVARRAHRRCEYCLIREEDCAFLPQVDHIVSRKHGGTSLFENLAYACVLCNRRKSGDVASIDTISGQLVRLFHPRQDLWSDHFKIDGHSIRALSEIGAATAKLLHFNVPERRAERALLQTLGSYPSQS